MSTCTASDSPHNPTTSFPYTSASGALGTGILAQSAVYTLNCTGTDGKAYTKSTTVSVSPAQNSPCIFNGQTVGHGASVTAYQSVSVPYGSQCASEERACSNGTLSGTFAHASCTAGPASTCTWNGATVQNGASVTAYETATVAFGAQCVSQTRNCENGILSGSYQYPSCSISSISPPPPPPEPAPSQSPSPSPAPQPSPSVMGIR